MIGEGDFATGVGNEKVIGLDLYVYALIFRNMNNALMFWIEKEYGHEKCSKRKCNGAVHRFMNMHRNDSTIKAKGLVQVFHSLGLRVLPVYTFVLCVWEWVNRLPNPTKDNLDNGVIKIRYNELFLLFES